MNQYYIVRNSKYNLEHGILTTTTAVSAAKKVFGVSKSVTNNSAKGTVSNNIKAAADAVTTQEKLVAALKTDYEKARTYYEQKQAELKRLQTEVGKAKASLSTTQSKLSAAEKALASAKSTYLKYQNV